MKEVASAKRIRKQMTRPWKLSVHAKLKQNEEDGVRPASIPELAVMLRPKNKKAGKDLKAALYKTLDPDGDWNSSADVDEICRILNLPPPLVEPDAELEEDMAQFRVQPRELRKAMLNLANTFNAVTKK